MRISPSRNPHSACRSSTAPERKAWATSSGIPSLLTGLASLKTGPASRRLASVRPSHGVGRQEEPLSPGFSPQTQGRHRQQGMQGWDTRGRGGTWGDVGGCGGSGKPPLLPRISLWQPLTRASTLAGRASRAAIQKGKTEKSISVLFWKPFYGFLFIFSKPGQN